MDWYSRSYTKIAAQEDVLIVFCCVVMVNLLLDLKIIYPNCVFKNLMKTILIFSNDMRFVSFPTTYTLQKHPAAFLAGAE